LGCALLTPDTAALMVDRVPPDYFTHPISQKIFHAVSQCLAAQQPTDAITVSRRLARQHSWDDTGTLADILELTHENVLPSLALDYIQQLEEAWQLRQLAMAGQRLTWQAQRSDQPPLALIHQTQMDLAVLTQPGATIPRSIGDIAQALWAETPTTRTPLSSGWLAYDQLSDGFPADELIIVAGRPGMGKTQLALQWARSLAERGHPAAFFSCEMSADQLVWRLISQLTLIPLSQLRQRSWPRSDEPLIEQAIAQLQTWPLYLDDTPSLSLPQLRAKARALHAQYGIQWLAVDYLQLLTPPAAANREQAVAGLSRDLKALARTLHIPLVVLSQLSRQVENRQDKRPLLADLRESGAIEQDADQVVFLYRPAYYDHSDDRSLECLLAKHRNGPTGVITCQWDPATGRIFGPVNPG
jgi:replicative DNA helicase